LKSEEEIKERLEMAIKDEIRALRREDYESAKMVKAWKCALKWVLEAD